MKLRNALIALSLTASMVASLGLPAYAAEIPTEIPVEMAETQQVNESQLSPWLITEVVTDAANGEKYTYLEIYNNSDQEMDFADYTLFYDYPTGGGFVFSKNAAVTYTSGKKYTSAAFLSAADNTELTSIKVPSGETLILWYNNNLNTTSLDEFKTYYGLTDVNIARVNHAGVHSSQKRGYRIGKDIDSIIAEAYSDEYGNMIANGNNKEAYQYTYPVAGRKCEQMSIAAATPGAVTEGQVPSARVTVKETPLKLEKVTATGEGDLVVTAEIPYEGTAGAMSVNLTYTQSAGTGEESVTTPAAAVEMLPAGDGKTFTATVPANTIFGTSAEYYITASYGGENKVISEKAAVQLSRKAASTEKAAPLLITEVAPTANEDGVERYDFFEIYNQSDETINLGGLKFLYYYNYPAQTAAQNGKTFTITDFTQSIAPGEVKVLWLNSRGLSLDDFNNYYGTELEAGKDVLEINYSGLHASDPRWFRIGTAEDTAFTYLGFNEASWQVTSNDLKDSVHYAVPNDDTGINESIPVTKSESTPGTLASWQKTDVVVDYDVNNLSYPGPADDGKKPTLQVCNESEMLIPESINEGEELQIMYDVDLLAGAVGAARLEAFKDYIDETNPTNHPGGSESLKTRPYLMGTEILYKLDNDTEWISIKEKKQWRLGHYLMKIPADVLFGHDSLTYKVRAYSNYGYNETAETTIKINRLNDTKGKVRLNVQDGSVISGSATITANDGADNANTVISVDGTEQSQKNVFEDGAYFTLTATGTDSYFKDAVTVPSVENEEENDVLTILTNWCEPTASKAIKVDNKYFKYNEEKDTYDVTLTIWAGSSGTPYAEIYDYVLTENHEDFTVSRLQMRLTNGKSYLPIKIEPENERINNSTELNASHDIGDSTGMIPHLDATFSIPAADAEAVGITLDTTTLTDGEHTVTAVAGEKTTTANVIVDNTKPSIDFGIEENAVVYDTIVLEEGGIAADANGIDEVVVSLDNEILELPAIITPNDLKAGEHVLKAVVTDEAGNSADKEIKFTTEDTTPEVSETDNDGSAGKSANLAVKLSDDKKVDVTFYEGKSLTVENNGIVEGDSAVSENGSVPYELFGVNVGEVEATDNIFMKWSGTASNANERHPLTMYVRNVKKNSWDAVATADENGNISAVFAAENYVENGMATVLVQTSTEGTKPAVKANTAAKQVAEAAETEQAEWDGTSRPANYDFAMAWETDTQYYTESFPYHYDNMNQWIVDNAEDWKIKYVFHTGDIVDDCDMIGEWENADRAMKILDDAGIPNGVLGGNHDVFAGAEDYGNYWRYFGADRYEGKDFYGGSYKNNLGHYALISEGGQDFVIIYMSWDIYTEELNWMNEVLQKYPDRKAILAFHRYIGVGADDEKLDYTGKLIQNEVVAKNKNVFAVLNGHYHGSSIQTDAFDDDGDGIKERTVYQICTDYQSDAEGGSEYIKFLYFDLANDKIYVNSYSPYRNDYNYYDAPKLENSGAGARATNQDILELDVDFDTNAKTIETASVSADVRTNTKIGSLKDVSGTVSYTWMGLNAETEYSWYAKVTNDKNGAAYTAVKTFKTGTASEDQTPDDGQTSEKAEAAKKAAEAAQAAAEAAQTEAEKAAEEAKTAQEAAGEASTKAEAAYDAAKEAQTKAEAAKTEAEALQTQVGADKAVVEAAKEAAQAAATEAAAAQAKAEAAQSAAVTAETNAQAAAAKAEAAKEAAKSAQSAAEAAKEAAQSAETNAQVAQAKAEAAATAALTAQKDAEAAKAEAVQARVQAQTAAGAAEAAKTAAEAAKSAAEAQATVATTASEAAKAAQSAAEAAKKDAEAAKAAAESEAAEAEAAKKDAEAAKAAAESEAAAANTAKAEAEKALADAKAEAEKLVKEAQKAVDRADELQKKLEEAATPGGQTVAADNFKTTKVQIQKPTRSGKKRIKVTWTKVEGAEGYEIQYATKKNFSGKKTATVKNGTKTSRIIKKLKSGKKYYVRIRAYKTVNGTKVYTDFSSRKTIRVK